ncbi:Indoleamine 2,3-dioxygenase [Dendrothele bispora CBS 962.96]|uniref:Indoleamine 2,3-dioxygenase n=1 Tax=Dendrothele bispora (strain CBS 962.96) TaxID=1314807 RepID=A0A4S8MTN4_DENBC|nr:Indoleamine 2,3-dioxygenase [Dendrothele bispora CBS 962.96]
MSPSAHSQTNLEATYNSDYDVDSRTGFMAPQIPLCRLPEPWEHWEVLLESAINEKFQPGDQLGISEEDKLCSERWRARVRETPIIPTDALNDSITLLRRAHLVLAFLMHFYVQSLPPDSTILIPKPISIPLLQVSSTLDMPPVVTLSDTVLYNWNFKSPPESPSSIDLDNLRCQTLFSGLKDEEEFYLSSARIEIRGVEALGLMHLIIDDMTMHMSTSSGSSSSMDSCHDVTSTGTRHGRDAVAESGTLVSRITDHLNRLALVVNDLKRLLLNVQNGCDPSIYYNVVRPWFRGEDSDVNKRRWIFEGVDELVRSGTLAKLPSELSGASAGQSSLIHALDIFLGVDNRRPVVVSKSGDDTTPVKIPSFLERMKTYMPRKHRMFLGDLERRKPSLREFVLEKNDLGLNVAYNTAVVALKEFRDSHMIIVARYIIGPARRVAEATEQERKDTMEGVVEASHSLLKGTGGTDMVRFLKGVRNQTAEAVVGRVQG